MNGFYGQKIVKSIDEFIEAAGVTHKSPVTTRRKPLKPSRTP